MNLDVEELGSVYESLLDYHPEIAADPPGFDLVSGSERKTTGSYYTPPDLVRELIDSALVPVMNERIAAAKTSDDKVAALLGMRIVDPAAGSGQFLLAAARRVGKELARIRSGEEEPAPTGYRHAVRDVIRECIYAVDKNPLAVDLCKVALWIEGHNAGQPLSFLDHHVKCGDSLVGVFDLKVLEDGIPDDAYKAVEGDDKTAAKHYRRINADTKKNKPSLPAFRKLPKQVVEALEALSHRDERTPEDVSAKEHEYGKLVNSPAMQNLENACNAWTAAFFVSMRMPEFRGRDLVPTSSTVWERLSGRQVFGLLDAEITKAKSAYSFFHWPVEFPDVFARDGFDIVLGNPPWEKLQSEEIEWFATRAPHISQLSGSRRKAAIAALDTTNPSLVEEWQQQRRLDAAVNHFVKGSERYPLTGIGKFNSYALFAELFDRLRSTAGRSGMIVPSGIATDDTTKLFFRELMKTHSLACLYDFENRKGIFPGVHRSYKFCLLTMAPSVNVAEFVFFALGVDELRDRDRRILLSAVDMALLNPNTETCPIFRTRRDAEITKLVYSHVSVIEADGIENPWTPTLRRVLSETDDSENFLLWERLTAEGWARLQDGDFRRNGMTAHRLYEGKMIWHFDHRYGSYTPSDTSDCVSVTDSEHADP